MDRQLDLSENFVLSSGTVPIDISKRLVLLLYYRPKGEYMLPKGRKNVGETLSAAAIRETAEESGFNCTLFKHQLHTNAQNKPVDPSHTEPIAIQQRMNQGVRKIIFWYIASIDSTLQRIRDTQEDGEEFDVEWVRIEHAPSKCSFDDDRKIVEKALEAVPHLPLASTPPDHQVRDAYLDATVDRQALGFLSISLGGSVVKQQTGVTFCESAAGKDWDGFGILETKASIVRLIRDFRAELCVMLRIEKEECPSLQVRNFFDGLQACCVLTLGQLPEDPMVGMQWEVLRFSGWTAEGSKRTIKLWSKEPFERVVCTSNSSHLGLLSHKVRRFLECSDPEHGSRLHIYQPVRVMEDLHILCDFDFMQGTTSEPVTDSDTAICTPFSPGVSYDLFLTSLCLFEYEQGFTASIKAAIIRKWQRLSRNPEPLSIIAFLYRTDAINSAYKSKLQAEIHEMSRTGADAVSANAILNQPLTDPLPHSALFLTPVRPPSRHKSPVV